MADPILEIESSEQDNHSRELFEIVHGTTAYRITTADVDVMYGGNLYISTTARRGEIEPPGVGLGDRDLEITLPVDHALVRRYLQMLSPPKRVSVTLRRLYETGDVETLWEGDIAGLAVDDSNTEATFRVPSRAASALLRVIPGVTASRTCPHTLYGKMCGISRNALGPTGLAHQITTSPLSIDGREVRVDLLDVGRLGTWAVLGELEHVASGEIMTVIDQTDLNPPFSSVTKLTLQLPMPPLKIGDQVKVSAGCNRAIETCARRFGNRVHFGGFNRLPRRNIHAPQNSAVGAFIKPANGEL